MSNNYKEFEIGVQVGRLWNDCSGVFEILERHYLDTGIFYKVKYIKGDLDPDLLACGRSYAEQAAHLETSLLASYQFYEWKENA